jgi:hypothetical protein
VNLSHHPIFDGAVMAQIALRHSQSVPKEKRMAQLSAPSLISNGEPMARWRSGGAIFNDPPPLSPRDHIQHAIFQHLRARGVPSVFALHPANGGYRRPIEAVVLEIAEGLDRALAILEAWALLRGRASIIADKRTSR